MVDLDLAEAAYLGKQLNDIDFGHAFVMDGSVCALRMVDSSVSAPEVFNDPDGDIRIGDEGWTAITNMSGQYSYHGAVFHASEFIGAAIAREMSRLSEDEPQTFVYVDVAEEDGDYAPDNGWVILYRENTVPEFKCLY